jgi:hypothetical protein
VVCEWAVSKCAPHVPFLAPPLLRRLQGTDQRPGLPQFQQPHVLLARGLQARLSHLASLLPVHNGTCTAGFSGLSLVRLYTALPRPSLPGSPASAGQPVGRL